jgi:hypothetical protein
VRSKRMLWLIAFCWTFAVAAHTQGHLPPPPKPSLNAPADTDDENAARRARDMAKKANMDRQAQLKADTDRLVKLAGELKDSVDKSTENVLSVEVLKKAEEIEKLAHSVKEKMRGSN